MPNQSVKSAKLGNFIYTLISIGLFVPSLVLAQLDIGKAGTNFKDVIGQALKIIGTLIPILFALAFLVFFWGLSKFILHSGNEAEVKKGKDYMLWGILALFLLVTSLAIINFLMGELGFSTDVPPLLPTDDVTVNFTY